MGENTSIQGVLIRHALDAPLEAVSIPLGSLPQLPPHPATSAPSGAPSTSNTETDSSARRPSSSNPYTDLFLSLTGSSDVFPGDTVAVTSVPSPFASRVDFPITIIYNAESKAPNNMRASRLTMALTTGVVTTICGSALVLGSRVGSGSTGQSDAKGMHFSSVPVADLEALDNAVHDEVMEYFCQGLVPREEDLDRIVREFRAGGFRYGSFSGDVATDMVTGEAAGTGAAMDGARNKDKKGKNAKGKRAGANKKGETALPGWGSGWSSDE